MIDLDEGMFYMSIEDYMNEFAYTGFNYPTEKMYSDHFLVEDDDAKT